MAVCSMQMGPALYYNVAVRREIDIKKKTIGSLGGMGPLATADLFQKIVLHTDASTDQNYLHISIDNNTDSPNQTAALLSDGSDSSEQMKKVRDG